MQIVVIGNGAVGNALIEAICNEGHNVTVIDESAETVSAVVNKYDVLGVTGNGASVKTQKEAGVSSCDVVIAVAQSDELNLLCCMIAKHPPTEMRSIPFPFSPLPPTLCTVSTPVQPPTEERQVSPSLPEQTPCTTVRRTVLLHP